MAIDRVKRRLILERSGAFFVIILCAVGGWFLVRYENARSRDVQALTRILEIQSTLASYAANHGVYPSMGQESRILGDNTAECLSSEGFVSATSDSCPKKIYGELKVARYTSLASDGATPCTDQNGCPFYKIDFSLETNSIAPKGIHSVSPTGLQ